MDSHQPKNVSSFTKGMGKTFFSRRCLQKCQQILISADKIWGEVPSLDDIFGSSLNIFPFCNEHGIGDVSTVSISNRNLSHCDWRTLKSSHL